MAKLDRRLLFTVPELKNRRWTDSGIRTFLAEPDDMRPNPYYGGALMKLYLISRVEAIERTPEWKEWLIKSDQRKRSARRGVTTKKQRLFDYVAEIEIEVPSMSPGDLLNRAISHYNNLWSGTEKYAHSSESPDFLARIQVNYLRHELTSYERHLNDIAGKTGAHEVRMLLRYEIYSAIAVTYPHLAVECRRQEKEREAAELAALSGGYM